MTDYEKEILSAHEGFTKAAKDRARAEANYKAVDSQTKTKLAVAYGNTESSLPAKTREMQALSDPMYVEWQKGVAQAREEYLKYKAQEEIGYQRVEVLRTLISLEKKRINIL